MMVRILFTLSLLFLFSAPAASRMAEREVFCTQDAKECPDGSYVGRTGPDCAFKLCPGETAPDGKKELEGNGCTKELNICPDGTGVGRTGPDCEFMPCPEDDEVIAPDDDASNSDEE